MSHLSRSVQRRVLRRKHEHDWASEAASALNEIGGFTTTPTAASVPRVSKLASDWVETAVHAMGPPPEGLDGRGAFRELQAKHSYTGEAVHVAPLDISLLSLPGSSRPRELSSLLERGADEVQAFIASSVLPKEQAAARMSEEDIPRRPYLDLVLYQPRRYEELLRAMGSCGMIEWALPCEEQVGLFCMWKKSGKQRLIIDARRSNAHFRTPAQVLLASGDSFGRLQALAGQALRLGRQTFRTPLSDGNACPLARLLRASGRAGWAPRGHHDRRGEQRGARHPCCAATAGARHGLEPRSVVVPARAGGNCVSCAWAHS